MKQKKVPTFVQRFKQQIKLMEKIGEIASEKPITRISPRPMRGPEISDIARHRPDPLPRA
jgi:hypothetical protein